MTDLSLLTACVVDHGLFLPLAQRLAQEFGRVLYFSPWEEGFPVINRCVLGDGFASIERCDDIWKVKADVDLFVFPDIHHSGLQLELESQGKAVWGSRNADSLEIWREKFYRVLGEVGLEVAPFKVVEGLSALRQALRETKDKWIKLSKFRGSFETTHWRSWAEDAPLLDLWAVKFGPCQELLRFLVCDAIETDLEIGCDTFCVDGQWPSLLLHGDEWKDKAYLAAVTERAQLPEQIEQVLAAFVPVLRQENYRNQFSMELRVAGDKAYFTDITCRGGLPSTASQIALWKNLPEIIWHGAHGELIQPEPAAKFSAEAILTMKGDKQMWGKLALPTALREVVKLGSCCEVDGVTCFPPDDSHGEAIGWLVAVGDTIQETIETLKNYADQLPDGVEAKTDSLVNLLKEIHEGEEQGIEFSSQTVPEPESVVADA